MDQNYLPFRFSSSPPPSSSLSLNSNIFATENINHLGHYNNNSNSSNINSAAMMKMASANVINNGGFLGLMSEMDRIENHHQGNVNGSTTTPTSVSQNISLENTTSPNNNDNKLGLTSMSSKKSSSSSTSKGQKKVRKPRYAFQTRSQVDILDDGYRWRKYGQKAVKNNKFPRSYYRCTYQGCNVKKQVQRLTKDESIVVTTYEGMHSHSIDKSTDNFEHILTQMQIYTSF